MSQQTEFDPANLEAEFQYALDRGDTKGAEELAENLRDRQEAEREASQ